MNIVIAAAFGYQSSVLVPFVLSLRKVFGERVALLIRPSQVEEMAGLANAYRVELFVIDQSWHSAPEIDRYFACRQFLSENHGLNNVFLSDSRDVLFQRSPFLAGNFSELYVFAEPIKIGMCDINSAWIKHYYGGEVLASMLESPVLCSGTTLGSVSRIKEYLDLMCEEIEAKILADFSYIKGGDQGIHNYKFHSGGIPGAVVRMHGYSEVQTLHHEHHFTFSRDCFILNFDGTVVSVVHQYDRFPQFFPLFQTMINR